MPTAAFVISDRMFDGDAIFRSPSPKHEVQSALMSLDPRPATEETAVSSVEKFDRAVRAVWYLFATAIPASSGTGALPSGTARRAGWPGANAGIIRGPSALAAAVVGNPVDRR